MKKPPDHEAIYPRPLSGDTVNNPPPALLPSRVPLTGKEVTLEPMNVVKKA